MPRIVTYGEIMARLETPGYQRLQSLPGELNVTFAGAEASVAVSYSLLGGESCFVTALPEHAVADACVRDLQSYGVQTQHILRTGSGRLGLYFYEHGINHRPASVIYDRTGSAVSMTPSNGYDWETILAETDWFVVSGITPALSSIAAEATQDAVERAKQLGVRVACDMNYRSKLWRWEPELSPRELARRTMSMIVPSVDLLLAGRDDLAETLGVTDAASVEELSANAVSKFPNLQYLAMSVREDSPSVAQRYGTFLYDVESGSAFQSSQYEIGQVVDRLGTGDAMTAALLFGMTTAELSEPQKAIEFAAAAGCLAHSNPGDYHLSSRKEIEALVQGADGSRVQR
ncbi:MAG: sugar kinase [Planctomycetaceae bacterium]|nr:sugar kinase [Planctomycetaceae bacterium]